MPLKLIMKKTGLSLGSFIFAISCCLGQSTPVQEIGRINPPPVALAPLRFLASDELMGRATQRPEINIAARYISEQFRSFGLKEVQGAKDYFQPFELKGIFAARAGSLSVNGVNFMIGQDLSQARGEDVSLDAPMVFAGYGTKADLDEIDVKGKIIVTNFGSTDPAIAGVGLIEIKRKLAEERGAVALIELIQDADVMWKRIESRLTHERVFQREGSSLPVFLIKEQKANLRALIQKETRGTISSTGNRVRTVMAKNVIGWVEGTDAKLKNEFIVLSAHYDHIGITTEPKEEEGKRDSIYNGARDNAIGVSAVINAARYFGQHRAKRSILFIAYSAEEIGLLGSKYFAENPLVPLQQLVYNLNSDNSSYNDTTIISVIGMGRTSADEDIKKAGKAYGLSALPDLAPEQNLFERSDHASLAAKGVPALMFSMGIRKFDSTITNCYHQLSDEVNNFNLRYAVKFMHAFILAAKYIADNDRQPTWTKGDKYEAVWKKLYGKSY